jgi:hypothetical protein
LRGGGLYFTFKIQPFMAGILQFTNKEKHYRAKPEEVTLTK